MDGTLLGTGVTDQVRVALEQHVGTSMLERRAAQVSQPVNPAQAATVARSFEALFINELYKTMRQAMLESSDDSDELSFGADILHTIGGIELAEQLARTGKGIGIAQLVYRSLTGSDDLPVITERPPLLHSSAPAQPPVASPNIEHTPPPQIGTSAELLSQRLAPHSETIERASAAHGVPEWLIKAVIAAESGGVSRAVSPAGAKGLMQLMDSTAHELGVDDAFDPEQNIWGGTQYLRKMLDRFGSIPLALAAYNAGPGAVQRYGGIPPYSETQNYVRRVQRYIELFRAST